MSRTAKLKSLKSLIILGTFLCIAALSAHAERGDLNLNGMPFELADAQLFEDYFDQGLGVFTIDLEAQIAASDINQDDLVLSIADYVMMLRIIFHGIESSPADSIIGMLYISVTDSTITGYSYFEQPIQQVTITLHMPDLISYEISLLPQYDNMVVSTFESQTLEKLIITINGDASHHFPNYFTRFLNMTYDGSSASLDDYSAVGFGGEVLDTQPDSAIVYGDINHNGVGFDLGDMLWFTNYNCWGMSAIGDYNLALQIKSSDVNQDGAPLTIADYKYFNSIYNGQIELGDPIGPGFSGTMVIVENDESVMENNTGSIWAYATFEENVGAVRISYYAPGLITEHTGASSITGMHAGFPYLDGDSLNIFVFSYSTNFIPVGPMAYVAIVFYDGPKPQFVSAEACGVNGEPVNLELAFSPYRLGNFDRTGNIDLLDILSLIGVLYNGEPNPGDGIVEAGDFNCDCALNLIDILSLINYVYSGSGQPCKCGDWLEDCYGR